METIRRQCRRTVARANTCAPQLRDSDDFRRLLNRALLRFAALGAGGLTVVRRQDALLPLVMHVHPAYGQETDYPSSPVATLLAQGLSVCQIAAATGRNENAIRSHMKQIYAKNGLSRQAELVRLVRALAGAPEARG